MNGSRISWNRLPCLAVAFVGVMAAVAGCSSESATPAPEIAPVAVPAESTGDPMAIIPEDISLWESFAPKKILKQPGTNTLVVEGVVPGDAAALAGELESASGESGWSTDTLSTHGGLTTLIMSKDSRRLKVNLTQDGDSVGVHLTTRLPE